jgi:hypothetical protein
MDLISYYEGTKVELQLRLKMHTQSLEGMIIGEVGYEEDVTFLKYGNLKSCFLVYAIFTGDRTQFVVTIINDVSGFGTLHIFESNWDNLLAMISGTRSIYSLYPLTTDKHRRGILKELGLIMYRVLKKFDNKVTSKIESSEYSIQISIDNYEVLTDLEWIEEVMEEYTLLNEE